jgi:transcriptional regulator with XRE-family HTH domain
MAAEQTSPSPAPPRMSSTPSWLWTSPSLRLALASRDVGHIFAAYRSIHHLTQTQLGQLIGFDQSYVCRIEKGRRMVRDVPTLTRIAGQLGLPPRLLGLMTSNDSDFEAMCQFAESTLRLADVSRRTGRPMEAVSELWPLVARLESRSTGAPVDPDVLVLLAEGCLALGLALGDVLPEEKLHFSARWTSRALDLATWLDDSALRLHALNLHGNELRKGGDHAGATALFAEALRDEANSKLRGDSLMLLARARGELGDGAGFDHAIHRALSLLDACTVRSTLFNPFSIRETHIRGLLSTGREREAFQMVNDSGAPMGHRRAAPPQWQVIEQVTMGGVLAAAGDIGDASKVLLVAIGNAEAYCLPHQVQRALRIAESMPTDAAAHVIVNGKGALGRLSDVAALPTQLTSSAGAGHR